MVPLLFHVEYISHFVPAFLLLTLNRQMPTVFPSHPRRQQIAQGLQTEVREILLEFCLVPFSLALINIFAHELTSQKTFICSSSFWCLYCYL